MQRTILATIIPLWLWASTLSFSVPTPRQKSLSVIRETTGQSISQKAPESAFVELSPQEQVLTTNLAEAGRKGDWSRVSQLYGRYTGSAEPVLTAAMQAAYRCKRYREAAKIYEKLSCAVKGLNQVSLLVALKIFGKLRDPETVNSIWAEATERSLVDKRLCGARIDAAAYMGDIEGAARVLDGMIAGKMELSVYVFNSAILACASAARPSHNAAMYLFQSLLDNGFSPTIITFANLAQAHAKASLEQIQHMRAMMKRYNVRSNAVFAECCLGALFQRRTNPTTRTTRAIDAALADLHQREARLKEAESVLLELQANKVELTTLCRRILKYVQETV